MRNDKVVPLYGNFHQVEMSLQTIVSSLAFIRNMASEIGSRDVSVTGDQMWALIGLIEDEAQRALRAHDLKS